MTTVWDKLKRNKELWDLFVKEEEYHPERLDRHNRFNYAFSRHKNVLEPVVSQFLTKNGFRVKYPDNKNFAVCLTHDVDNIYPPITHIGLSSLYALKNGNFDQIRQQVLWKFGRKSSSPYRNFEQVMEMESKFGAKSTFYFMTAETDIRRFRYHIEDLEDTLKLIVDSGWEVGLHIGYYSFDNLEAISSEKEKLEKALGSEVTGCRSHYLRFKVPDTWEILAKAGFEYDTTFGYIDHIGFRNGLCHPYQPFNLSTDSEIDIIEIPLAVTDDTLFRYMKLDFNKSLSTVQRLIDMVEEHAGVLTLLWHNDDFSCPFREKWAELYQVILKYCYEKNAWMTSADEIYKWYHENKYLEIISEEIG